MDKNNIEWRSNKESEIYKSIRDRFIFSFKNSYNIESYILGRVKREIQAILNYHDFGPSFGGDLTLFGDYGTCINRNFEKKIRETTDVFYVEEYEVFQIIRED
ncbi:hypothetical protein GLOIN_2v1881828 [Rhizophagus irregularis DAOM 181602=DAOM 197198]|nr:hypothetical protein GLOIN_2v1881828 [Rhizophagus irregularis DAOM 181602=DAOM 197198]